MMAAYVPMMQSAALVSASKLGLFEALAAGPLSLEALAKRLDCPAQSVQKLADFLGTLDFLEPTADGYANSVMSQRWFTSQGQVDYSPGLNWTHAIWDMMGTLDGAVRRNGPETLLWDSMVEKPELGSAFAAYMRAFALDLGPDLLHHVPVADNHRKLLDLGGSHGLHSLSFCHRYPALSATIVDFPGSLQETGPRIAAENLAERVALIPGNLLHEQWPREQDVVFYLSVAHNQTAADNAAVIKRIRQSLNPGGLLVIHEYLDDHSRSNPFHAAFRLTLLLETGTRIYAFAEYEGWLRDAGFSAVTRIDLDPIEKGSLLLARV